MYIVVAPDSFKGSLPALEVAEAMEQGIRSAFPAAKVKKAPIADGGEGTVNALVLTTGGSIEHQTVKGPLGEKADAYWGILGDGNTAVIEMAAASGLTLVPEEKLNPMNSTSFGTGQLILAALDKGMRKLIIGLGGTATNDGGAGIARALGVRFLDDRGTDLPDGAAALSRLAAIDLTGLDPRLAQTEILVACDVGNPLFGPTGASMVYGPQKGATPTMAKELDEALQNYARVAGRATGRDVAACLGAGAAGGSGAGLMFFTNAKLRPGVEIVLEVIGFEHLVQSANLVITGEGSTDFQTASGKAPVGVAKLAKKYGVPTVCLSGGLGNGYEGVFNQGIAGIMPIIPHAMPLEKSMACAAELIRAATGRLCRLIAVGIDIGER